MSKRSILEKLFDRSETSSDDNNFSKISVEENIYNVRADAPITGKAGDIISAAANIRCKECKEIIVLSARIPIASCSCGKTYRLG